jgi:uncharacterized protein YdhG (YjbR/CyaY superfamily)
MAMHTTHESEDLEVAPQFETIEEYIESRPSSVRPLLESIRETIRATAPDAVETISYQMPCFKWKGKSLIHFGAWKRHIGIYPIPSGTAEFETRIEPYVKGKGTVQFSLRTPIPLDIVRTMVTLRMNEIAAHSPR